MEVEAATVFTEFCIWIPFKVNAVLKKTSADLLEPPHQLVLVFVDTMCGLYELLHLFLYNNNSTPYLLIHDKFQTALGFKGWRFLSPWVAYTPNCRLPNDVRVLALESKL